MSLPDFHKTQCGSEQIKHQADHTYLQLLPVANTAQFLYQTVIATLHAQKKSIEEIQNLKVQVSKLQQQTLFYQKKIDELESMIKDSIETNKKKSKIFKKNIECPFPNCSNTYSSRIALNSHKRAKHRKSENQKTIESERNDTHLT